MKSRSALIAPPLITFLIAIVGQEKKNESRRYLDDLRVATKIAQFRRVRPFCLLSLSLMKSLSDLRNLITRGGCRNDRYPSAYERLVARARGAPYFSVCSSFSAAVITCLLKTKCSLLYCRLLPLWHSALPKNPPAILVYSRASLYVQIIVVSCDFYERYLWVIAAIIKRLYDSWKVDSNIMI